jgi:hypothetical protein
MVKFMFLQSLQRLREVIMAQTPHSKLGRAELDLQRMRKQRDALVTALRACEALTAKRRDQITNHEIMAVRRIILVALAGVMP